MDTWKLPAYLSFIVSIYCLNVGLVAGQPECTGKFNVAGHVTHDNVCTKFRPMLMVNVFLVT